MEQIHTEVWLEEFLSGQNLKLLNNNFPHVLGLNINFGPWASLPHSRFLFTGHVTTRHVFLQDFTSWHGFKYMILRLKPVSAVWFVIVSLHDLTLLHRNSSLNSTLSHQNKSKMCVSEPSSPINHFVTPQIYLSTRCRAPTPILQTTEVN